MPSKSELNLMTQILDLEGFNVIDYRLIEDIAIILSLENTKKEVICPKCGKLTDRVHTNNGMDQKRPKMGYKTAQMVPAAKHCKHNTKNRIKLEI